MRQGWQKYLTELADKLQRVSPKHYHDAASNHTPLLKFELIHFEQETVTPDWKLKIER
jgi:hypothetical protein